MTISTSDGGVPASAGRAAPGSRAGARHGALVADEGSRASRLLAEALGYAVRRTDGETLGRLIWLVYDVGDAWPAGLRVQPPGAGGPTFDGSWEIPVDRVVEVCPEKCTVVVAGDPGPAGRRPE